MLKLLDLFSGIGGFSLGMEATKQIKTIGFVEKDKFCQKVLRKNFKNVPIDEEIRNVKGSKYTADIISGGFPCQPFSVAGKRRGTEDDRYLWDQTIRVIRECKPRWFIGKMLKALLTSPKVKSCNRYKKIWKQRVSKSNVLLFQLQVSVRGIKEKEFGLLHTPTATEIGIRSPAAMEKRKKYRESIGRKTVPPGNLLEQIQMKMLPTPNAWDGKRGARSQKNLREKQHQINLITALKDNQSENPVYQWMYPTPTARDHKDMGYQPTWKPSRDKSLPREVLKNNKPDGKLNPIFVEMLMAYPMNWTKIEKTE